MAENKKDTPSFSGIGSLNFNSGKVTGSFSQSIQGSARSAPNWVEVRAELAALQELLQQVDVPDAARSEAAADISTSLTQAQKKTPDTGIIRQSLQTAKGTIEVFANANGAALFIQKIVGLFGML